jgi:ABC-2 type transport system ATP-binding protein
VRKYSKGMMQRLGLAQALLNNPDLLILDEPTDGVDPVGRKEIREILHSLKQEGKSVFLNSHLLSEVERVSDRVAIMKNGTIVTEGSLDYLTSTHNIYQLKVEEQYYSAVPNILHSSIVQFQDSIYDLSFASNVDMNKAIDLLRKEGIIIESIIPKRTSLEDVFISLIKDSTVHRV